MFYVFCDEISIRIRIVGNVSIIRSTQKFKCVRKILCIKLLWELALKYKIGSSKCLENNVCRLTN
jgi:hypothetical protein